MAFGFAGESIARETRKYGFSIMNVNMFDQSILLISITVGFQITVLFLYLYRQVSRRPENLVFSMLTFLLTTMLFCMLQSVHTAERHQFLFWYRLQFVAAYLSMGSLLYFVTILTHPTGVSPPRLAALYSGAAVGAGLSFYPQILRLPSPGALHHQWDDLAQGPLFCLYAPIPVGASALALGLLHRTLFLARRQEAGEKAFSPLTEHWPWFVIPLWMFLIGCVLEILDQLYLIDFNVSPRAIAFTCLSVGVACGLGREITVNERRKHALTALISDRFNAISGAQHQVKDRLETIRVILVNINGRPGGIAEPDIKQRVEMALEEVAALSDTLRITLNIACVEAGQPLNLGAREKVDFPDLVEKLLDKRAAIESMTNSDKALSLVSEPRKITIKHEMSREKVLIHENPVRQVLINLIDNAFKYSPATSPLSVHLWENEREFFFQITDCGNGLRAEDCEKIFTRPFYRSEADRYSVEGVGLGLNLARRYVSAHGGRIWAESAGLGQGSSFIVALPLARE